ncbi:hypothetical protein [Burkholderia multivorans]|uniref:hypothetical protein n=1 Tax=Burkholderia multivorans TaxID=87883 RepID=UPI0019CF9D9F|nr:hypothetical protein [Burkholderia multivorans]MBN6729298.1 hypothetical protein [Burkholderia multivorans]MBN6737145.1 hypothetical protein [Burkholderia multivorans]MBN7125799.1 hypothetical protein [Burkholderia multivorans]MBN8167637.1 hypothetical protein [Burkholderia multivorans]QSL25402.1 hypothetical protein G0D92_09465 [Burkholderia multivorans]
MSTKKFEEMVRQNPESFDYGDTPADRNLSERYFEQLMPEPFKKELSKRAGKDAPNKPERRARVSR